MLPEELHNPETAALGLDVDALKGKSIAEVRRLVDRGDCALVLANEDVPSTLPAEVMRKEPNVCDGKPALSWMYQTNDGQWRGWSSYVVDEDFVRRGESPRAEIVFGQIYTRQARATPGIRVRPIARVDFDSRGTCLFASDADAQMRLLLIGAEGRLRSLHASPSAKPRVATPLDPQLDALVGRFDLPTPVEGIVLGDWKADGSRTARFLWGNECELRSLILFNAQMDQRIVISRTDDGPWWLAAVENGAMCPTITLDERGLRVSFTSVTGEVGPALDVYAGRLGIHLLDDDGTAFRASVVVAQRSSPLAPSGVAPVIQILGHRVPAPTATNAVVARLLDSDQRLEVTSPNGTKSLEIVSLKRVPSTESILLDARPA